MGGTTAKASLVRDGEPTMAEGYYVGGYASGHPVMMPVVDVVEVGAGGGEHRLDRRSRRAQSGPAKLRRRSRADRYGRGGNEPTITDANVVLGRHRRYPIFLAARCGSTATRPFEASRSDVAALLQMHAMAAARSIVQIAIAKMSLAVREVSVEKGYDPRDFVLVASGGAGPLHASPSRASFTFPP